MASIKRILCLANSKKPSGRCIAGREVTRAGAGLWIRPVSSRPGEEVSEDERQYEDGSDPKVLDVVDIPLLQHHPHACQTENWLLDPSQYWQRARRSEWTELQAHVENPQTLWINGNSTYHGLNDEIPQAIADKLPRSLYLIRVPRIDLRVFAPSEAFGNPKRRVQGHFQHAAIQYTLWVTDPYIERNFLARGDGSYSLGECCLTVSLGEPYEKKGQYYRYKLVAAVIERAQGAVA